MIFASADQAYAQIGPLAQIPSINYSDNAKCLSHGFCIVFDKDYYRGNELARIYVFDSTADPATPVTISVNSDDDHQGISLTLDPVNGSPHFYRGMIHFGGGGPSAIDVNSGSWVYAIYKRTPFNSDADGDDARVLVIDQPRHIMFDKSTYDLAEGAAISLVYPGRMNSDVIEVQVENNNAGTSVPVVLQRVGTSDIFVNQALLEFSLNSISTGNFRVIGVNPNDSITATHFSDALISNPTNLTDTSAGIGGTNIISFGQPSPTYIADCAYFGGDTDHDGICNNWELTSGALSISGIPNVGTYNFPLCSSGTTDGWGNCMGTSAYDPQPLSRYSSDVFVQVDSCANTRPNTAALTDVVNAFSNNNHNIRVHIQLNPNAMSMGGLTCTLNFPQDFNTLKSLNFAGDDPNNRVAKAQVFHYVEFVHDFASPNTGNSGIGEVPGNDFAIALDTWGSTQDQQEGTFMHELGHNLGLMHGGHDGINCKPNYLSVMSYPFQFASSQFPSQDGTKRPLDYSEQAQTQLIENSLPLTNGIGLVPSLTGPYYTFWGTPMSHGIGTFGTTSFLSSGGTIGGTTTIPWPISEDVDHLNIAGCGLNTTPAADNTLTVASGDWSSLNLQFRGSSNFDDGIHIVAAGEEINKTTYHALMKLGIQYIGRLIDNATTDQETVDTAISKAQYSIDKDDIAGAIQILKGLDLDTLVNDDNERAHLKTMLDTETSNLSLAIPIVEEKRVIHNNQTNFTISTSPGDMTIPQGSSSTASINVSSLSGFSSATSLSVTGTPEGVTTAFSDNSITPSSGGSATSTLTINVSDRASTGSSTLTVTGTSGSLTHTATISLNVTSPTSLWPMVISMAVIVGVTALGIWTAVRKPVKI